MSDAKPLPFPDFCVRFLQLYEPPLRAPATHKKVRQALRLFARQPGVVTTDDLSTVNVAAWVAGRAGNVNTTLSLLRCLRTASHFARDEGWLDRLPQWRRLLPRAAPPSRRRHLDHAQVVALLAHLGRLAAAGGWAAERLYALASLVAYTGLRSAEAHHLHAGDLDPGERLLYVVPRRRLKTEGSAAPVPLPDELVPVLDHWAPLAAPSGPWLFPGVKAKGPWWGGSPGYRSSDHLRRAGDAVGVPGLTWHALRHTLGKLLVGRFGATADQVKSVLRHTDVRTTEEHYLHRDDAECLRRIVRHVSFRPDPDPTRPA